VKPITRRRFLGHAGQAAACLAATKLDAFQRIAAKPKPNVLKHIIVVMMENRSFDHFLGWLPGADGMQQGLMYPDRGGNMVSTYPLAPDYQGCGHPVPSNTFEDGRTEFHDGACDGWLIAGTNDAYTIGYYGEQDLPFLGAAAQAWTTCDRYFSAIMAPTWPNRLYQHCGVTDRIDNSFTPTDLPTIWDRLASHDLVGKYYYSDLPFLALWGTKYAAITHTYDTFLDDCASGDLPHVAFVDPRMAFETEGGSTDDHPHADIRAGEWFLEQTYRAVINSPAWKHTVMVINFDEWGGFFDHVPPTLAPDVDPTYQLRGFRVPCLIVSPFARRQYITSQVYDHTSVLKMIEWRWDLPALSVRDANANNLADELDFTKTKVEAAPDFDVPFFPDSIPCAFGRSRT